MSNDDMNTSRMSGDPLNDQPKEDALISTAPRAQYSGSSSAEQDTDILGQLRELGGNLITAIQAIGQSDVVRNLQQDISSGLRNVADQVGSATQNVGETDVAKNVKEQATKVTANPVVRDVQTNLTAALRELNQRIVGWADNTRTRSQQADGSDSEPESVQLTLPGEVGDIVEPDNGKDKPTTKLND